MDTIKTKEVSCTIIPALPGYHLVNVTAPEAEDAYKNGERQYDMESIIAWRITTIAVAEGEKGAGQQFVGVEPITLDGASPDTDFPKLIRDPRGWFFIVDRVNTPDMTLAFAAYDEAIAEWRRDLSASDSGWAAAIPVAH